MQNAIPMLLGMPGMAVTFPVPIEQAAQLHPLTTAGILENFCPLVHGSIQGVGREDITLTPEEASAPVYYTLPIHRIAGGNPINPMTEQMFARNPMTEQMFAHAQFASSVTDEVAEFFRDEDPAAQTGDDSRTPLFVRAHVSHLDWHATRFFRTAFEVSFGAKRLAGEHRLPYQIPGAEGWTLKEFLEGEIPVGGSEGLVFEDTGEPIGVRAGSATFVNPEGRLVQFDLMRPDIGAAITAGYEGNGAAASIRMNIHGDTQSSSTDSYFFALQDGAVGRFMASSGMAVERYATEPPRVAFGRYISSQDKMALSLLKAGRFIAALVLESTLFQDHAEVGGLVETLSDAGFSIVSQTVRKNPARSSEPGPLIHIEGAYNRGPARPGQLKIRLRNPLCSPIARFGCDTLELGFFLADVLWDPIAKIAAPGAFTCTP